MQYRDTYTGMHLQCSEMSYECLMTIEEAICTFMSINSVTFFSITVGLGAFIYHIRYANKPHTLDDGYSDSGGCSTSVDDSLGGVKYFACMFDITVYHAHSGVNVLVMGSIHK